MKHAFFFLLCSAGLVVSACQKADESVAPASAPVPTPASAPVLAAGARAPVDKAAVGSAQAHMAPIGSSGVRGTLALMALPNQAGVRFVGQLSGLKPGPHGIHVHEVGNCDSTNGMSAGGHYNPTVAPHGQLEGAGSHVGDLGNIVADAQGTARLDIIKAAASLAGPASLLGRSIIVHADADDLATQPAGKSGARISCGVIARP